MRREHRMARVAGAGSVLEDRHLRPADDIDIEPVGGRHETVDPVRVGDLVVVDHQKMAHGRKPRQRGLPAGIVGGAIAALMGDQNQTGQLTVGKQGARGIEPGAALGIVLHDDHGEGTGGPLRGQRGERLQEMLGPAEGRKGDDDREGVAIEAGRFTCDGDGVGHRSRSGDCPRFGASRPEKGEERIDFAAIARHRTGKSSFRHEPAGFDPAN